MRAGVALGSNLGDRLANMVAARDKIRHIAGVMQPLLSSDLYETEPVGCEPGAAAFLNSVIDFEFKGAPDVLLRELNAIEVSLGRERPHSRNASRSIDLDLLYLGDVESAERAIQLPHPRLAERRFVLEPLAEIRPDLVLPGQRETVAMLRDGLPTTPKVVRIAAQW